jgi:diguanylate cyclase (GGDEF)-like protein
MTQRDRKLLLWIETLPRSTVGTATVLLMVAAGIGNWRSGADVAFTLAYLLPIAIASWYLGRVFAVSVAIVSSLSWLAVDLWTRQFALDPAISSVNFAVQLLTFLLFSWLLAALRTRLHRENQLAHTDSLTGLHNRRAFWSETRRELRRCRRFHLPLSLLYLDVDDFKRVNDRFGHQRGDELLQGIARSLLESVRDIDTAARVGGDEFAVLLPGTDQAGASAAIERLRANFAASRWYKELRAGCSMGCVTCVEPPAEADELIANADRLMYETKRANKGSVRFASFGSAPAAKTTSA